MSSRHESQRSPTFDTNSWQCLFKPSLPFPVHLHPPPPAHLFLITPTRSLAPSLASPLSYIPLANLLSLRLCLLPSLLYLHCHSYPFILYIPLCGIKKTKLSVLESHFYYSPLSSFPLTPPSSLTLASSIFISRSLMFSLPLQISIQMHLPDL